MVVGLFVRWFGTGPRLYLGKPGQPQERVKLAWIAVLTIMSVRVYQLRRELKISAKTSGLVSNYNIRKGHLLIEHQYLYKFCQWPECNSFKVK